MVLGQGFTPYEQQDVHMETVESLMLVMAGGRYKTQIDRATAGNLVLISGIDRAIEKTATLFDASADLNTVDTFRDINFQGVEPVIKIACEPLQASELPKMISGLRKATRCYPLCQSKIEESGEHILLGTGELYLDQVLHDIRKVFNREFELHISEPFIAIAETVADTSSVKCACETPNHKNKLCMVAQPLENGLPQ